MFRFFTPSRVILVLSFHFLRFFVRQRLLGSLVLQLHQVHSSSPSPPFHPSPHLLPPRTAALLPTLPLALLPLRPSARPISPCLTRKNSKVIMRNGLTLQSPFQIWLYQLIYKCLATQILIIAGLQGMKEAQLSNLQ